MRKGGGEGVSVVFGRGGWHGPANKSLIIIARRVTGITLWFNYRSTAIIRKSCPSPPRLSPPKIWLHKKWTSGHQSSRKIIGWRNLWKSYIGYIDDLFHTNWKLPWYLHVNWYNYENHERAIIKFSYSYISLYLYTTDNHVNVNTPYSPMIIVLVAVHVSSSRFFKAPWLFLIIT